MGASRPVAGVVGQHIPQKSLALRIRGEPHHDLLEVGPIGFTGPVRDVAASTIRRGPGIMPDERKGRRIRVQQQGPRLAQRLPADPMVPTTMRPRAATFYNAGLQASSHFSV